MSKIQEDFNLKDDKIEESDMYLGATLSNIPLEGGKTCLMMSNEQYVNAAVTDF